MRLNVAIVLLIAGGCGTKQSPPYSPREALSTFRLAPGFRIELAAAEPDVVDPVAFSFDASGRLFVVEMTDYPDRQKPLGRVKLLEDRDADGRFEHSVIFADGLPYPNGVMAWKKGILVTCAPDILYLEDADGDGSAEIRKVVLTGFAAYNPQLRLNGLQYGLDNWIYAACPRVPRKHVKQGGEDTRTIRYADRPGSATLDLKGQDLRFQPEKGALEAVSGNSQFGNAFDTWGDRFTVWNNDHVRHVVLTQAQASRNPNLAIASAMKSISGHGNAAQVKSITRQPLHIHDTEIGHFTSACGLSVYTGGNFPAGFESTSFTCEPVHNLIHRDVLSRIGPTFTADQAYPDHEFLASTDSWFRPVFTGTGPDGALYVADFYRHSVEHPEFVPPELAKEIDFQPKGRRGRIWRIVSESAVKWDRPRMDAEDSKALVRHLSHANGWWRNTAQRLIVDRGGRAVVPDLLHFATAGASPMGRIHALQTLDGLGALTRGAVAIALEDPNARVREHAIRLAETRLPDDPIERRIMAMAGDLDARVQFAAAAAMGGFPVKAHAALIGIAVRHMEDEWFRIAVLSAATDDPNIWLRSLLATPAFSEKRTKGRADFVRRLGSIAGARKDAPGFVMAAASGRKSWWRAPLLDGLSDGLRHSGHSSLLDRAVQAPLLKLAASEEHPVALAALNLARYVDWTGSAGLPPLLSRAKVTALNPNASNSERVRAVRTLGVGKAAETLEQALNASHPEEIRVEAVKALAGLPDTAAREVYLRQWRGFTPRVGESALAWFMNGDTRVAFLLDAIEAGKMQAWSLGRGRLRQLQQYPNPEIRARIQKIAGESGANNRMAVYHRFRPALRLPGDAGRGRQVYEKNGSECHRAAGIGHEMGPDLKTVAKRYKETLLADILMPNQNIENGYEEYLIETVDGRSVSGVLAQETPTALTVRRAKGEQDTVLRSQVKSMRALAVSPMPEDLERGIDIAQMADLLAFLKKGL